ncbi:hypothetical protein EDD16DRAFT_973392 [Pisolithus croceorrhizus]|nr:hypothetical protein EDD16DRAFT_973392 [Pisolithus croceorrhizus]KAI6163974.1 hypothetical protein EDD17DRAFT_407385 [Pisolithus thermaeus]
MLLGKSVLCDIPDEGDGREILKAVSRMVTLDASVDFNEIARTTEGFSGAALQALLCSAHLRVVHALIDASPTPRRCCQGLSGVEERVEYVTFGGSDEWKTLSRADESQIQRRLR